MRRRKARRSRSTKLTYEEYDAGSPGQPGHSSKRRGRDRRVPAATSSRATFTTSRACTTRFASTPERGRVLDLGCGVNADLENYRTPDREVWGTDFQAHPELQHPEWFRLLGNGGRIPFPDDHFDSVTAVMVLEHVADPRAFLSEVARVLRPGGRFIGHTISGTHYVTFIRRLFGLLPHAVNQTLVKKLYGRAEADTFPAFYRLNTEAACGGSAMRLGWTRRVRRYADPGYFRFARPLETAAILAGRRS